MLNFKTTLTPSFNFPFPRRNSSFSRTFNLFPFLLLYILIFSQICLADNGTSGKNTDVFVKQSDLEKIRAITFSGTITKVSVVPNPKKNDYANCLYCVELTDIKMSENSKYSHQLILAIPVMKNKQLITENIFKEKQKITVSAVEYEKLPEYIKQIQISDTIENFEAPMYYFLKFEKNIDSSKLKAPPSEKIITLPKPLVPSPADHSAQETRKKRIQSELARANHILAQFGNPSSRGKKHAEVIEEIQKMQKENKKGWINGAFFASPSWFWIPEKKADEFIQSLLPYKNYLRQNNIDLILLRVPSKGELSSAVFLSTNTYTDNLRWTELYKKCLVNDIEVIDPLPEMWKRYNAFFLSYFYHIPNEGHPFTGASFIIADVLASVLKRYTLPSAKNQFILSESQYSPGIKRAYYPEGNSQFDSTKTMSFPVVLDKSTRKPFPIQARMASPFLFCSNSYAFYPNGFAGGSIPHYTAYKTGITPAWFYQDGVHLNMLRNCIANPDILQDRKAVILVMSAGMWCDSLPPFPFSIEKKYQQLICEKTLSPTEIQKTISMKNLPDAATKYVKTDNQILSLTPYQNNEFIFSLEGSENSVQEPHMIRIYFKSHGYLKYRLHNSNDFGQISYARKTSALDLFFPAGCSKYEFSLIELLTSPILITSMEIYRCK